MFFGFLFTRKSPFFVYLKNVSTVRKHYFPAMIRFAFSFVFGNVGFPKRPLLPLFKMLSFLDCLFFFSHRIRPHVVVVVDEVEHQVDVVMAFFNLTPNRFRPEFFSAVQIADFTIYCKSVIEFVTKRGKNISVNTRKQIGNQDI